MIENVNNIWLILPAATVKAMALTHLATKKDTYKEKPVDGGIFLLQTGSWKFLHQMNAGLTSQDEQEEEGEKQRDVEREREKFICWLTRILIYHEIVH